MIMVKTSDLKTGSQVADEQARADPAVQRELERTALANDVAIRVIRYRAEHGLSQTQLARQLGLHQSAIARLEAGDHEPSLTTLGRLAKGLGVDFHIDITPDGRAELRPEQPDAGHSEAVDMFRVYIASIQADLRAEQRRREAFEKAVMSWQAHLSAHGQEPAARQGSWRRILAQLTALRAREEEDQGILENLERLFQDA
jgi:transcriptional regulator with XRE-family HTH domain